MYEWSRLIVNMWDDTLAPRKGVFHMIKFDRCRDTHGKFKRFDIESMEQVCEHAKLWGTTLLKLMLAALLALILIN